jgi:hypothetical protein
MPRWMRFTRLAVVLVAVVFVTTRLADRFGHDGPPSGVAGVPTVLADRAPEVERTVDVHSGYGTWVDVYDYVPSEGSAVVTPATVDEMADQGVRTLFLQTGQFDESGGELLADPDLVAQFLVRAHLAGMRVVGWYLPRFTDIDGDLAHLSAISDFEVLGHRFDGVAVDIEWTEGVPDHVERSDELVELSKRLRDAVDDDSLGAIVLPPVQTEVVNPRKWPDFPWRDLAGIYDVWLPMGYWTERRADSGYQDGWTYTDENVRRLRANLRDPDAPVHAIGGIGDGITAAQAERFVDALEEHDTIGGSIYDWVTLDPRVSDYLATELAPSDD